MIELGELREAANSLLSDWSTKAGCHVPDEGGWSVDRQLWQELAGMGWFSLALDESSGGLGLGLSELLVLYEELGRTLAPVPALGTLLAIDAIQRGASDDQRRRWVPALASGELSASVVLPGAQAPLSLEQGRLTGTLEGIDFLGDVDLLIAPVQASGGLSLAVLEREAAGANIVCADRWDLTRQMFDVRLESVEVADEALIPASHALQARLEAHAALALAADSTGGAAAVLEKTIEYLGMRVQFERPIGSFQALKHRAASWKVALEAATALTHSAAGAENDPVLPFAAKFYACDTYAAIAGDAVQLHGGIGFTWEHPCHLFLKRAKANQTSFGTALQHKDRVAAAIIGDAPGSRARRESPVGRQQNLEVQQ